MSQSLSTHRLTTTVRRVRQTATGLPLVTLASRTSLPRMEEIASTDLSNADFTVERLSSLDSTELLDTSTFAFFKGANGPADADGNVQATVTGGLPEGDYKLTSINTYANHQPIVSTTMKILTTTMISILRSMIVARSRCTARIAR